MANYFAQSGDKQVAIKIDYTLVFVVPTRYFFFWLRLVPVRVPSNLAAFYFRSLFGTMHSHTVPGIRNNIRSLISFYFIIHRAHTK